MKTLVFTPRNIQRLLLQIVLLALGVINIYPFIWMISSSLKSLPEFALGGINIIPIFIPR